MNMPADTYSALAELKTSTALTPRTMPPSFYKDESLFSVEMEELFIKGWVCLGRSDEIPEPGDYFTVDICNEPLIIVRNQSADVSVLSNVCRHRGSQILTGRGNSKRFTCPYHLSLIHI